MRLLVAMFLLLTPVAGSAADVDSTMHGAVKTYDSPDFQLGGALARSTATPEATPLDYNEAQPRLSAPAQDSIITKRNAAIGPATLYLGEGLNNGREAFEMGTFLRSGQARAGISLTYLEHEAEVSRSEIFVDYSLTERFSVGLSGILNSELAEDETVPQVGINAEYSTEGGALLRGGFAGATDYSPVVGVSIGLRF